MSKTLNLIDILLTTSRHLTMIGRSTEALATLSKLAAFRDLPTEVLVEICVLRADLYLQRKNYKDARRNLAAAIAAEPLEAHHHYLMAVAIDEDEEADRARAEMYYRQAVELDPAGALYWLDFANYSFKQGNAKQGLKALRKAAANAEGDADLLGDIAKMLRREGHVDEAARLVRKALFESHGAPELHALWQQHQIDVMRLSQQKEQPTYDDAAPVILPFAGERPTGRYLEMGGKTFRIDQAQPLDEPKTTLPIPAHKPPKKG